ncbi:MAG: response regulator transcription factor [Thermodesulfobacteriota bacterium]
MIRILVVDDHTLVRQAVSAMLDMQDDMQVVGDASTGREAVELCVSRQPQVVVMDVTMPDMNGVEATERILASRPGTRIVGLTMHADPTTVARMLKAGAAGYLLKNSSFLDLQTAVREAAAGRCYLSPAVAGTLVERFVRSPAPSPEAAAPRLTTREREVLQLLAEGLTSKEIAERLSLSVRTVENHRRQIMERLGLRSVAALTKYAVKTGITSLDF